MVRSLALLVLLAASVHAKPNRGPFKRIAVIQLREESGEAIDPSVKTSVLRRIAAIREWGADCVVFDIESYGGLVTASIETGDEIYALGRDVHTIAFVARKAISGAAMLSLSCQEIVMHEVGKIGDSQAVYMGADGELKIAPEKLQTTVATTFRTYAEGNGYPVPVAEAMVRQEMSVLRYKKPNDPRDASKGFTWVYFRADTLDGLPSRREIEELGLVEPPETVVEENELATFGAKEAMDYGLCSRLVNNLDDLIQSISSPDTEVLKYDWSWSERVSRGLLRWRFLLFLVGAGALYFALKMPGTGVPEALALVCFGLFFGASAIAGFAGAIEMVLFVTGIILLVVEIFILPGFGVAGFLGLGCILTSIGLAALPEGGSVPASPGYYLIDVAKEFLGAAIAAFIIVILIARNLPKLPYFNRLSLAAAPSQTGSAVAMSAAGPAHPLIGAAGVAESQLRPAGRARIDGKRHDVVTEGGFVNPGTPVKVVAVHGNVIVVRPDGDAS